MTVEKVAIVTAGGSGMGAEAAKPLGPRRAIIRFGEPINVGERLAELGKPRAANGKITEELQGRIQHLLDVIGPGRPVEDRAPTPSVMAPRVPLPAKGS